MFVGEIAIELRILELALDLGMTLFGTAVPLRLACFTLVR
jgi:hypothetical protein